jgi:hypothetical protein
MSTRRFDTRGSLRNGARCRLSHQSHRDLKAWKQLAKEMGDGGPIRPLAPDGIKNTDAADVGYGGTLDVNGSPGDPGKWSDQGIRTWHDRAECISVRELKAIRMLHMGNLGERVQRKGIKVLRLCVDNTSVKFVTKSFAAASRPNMRELRQFKRVLDYLGLQLSSEWLPSILNKYAEALSRRFKAGDLSIRRTFWHLVMAGMQAPADSFPLRPLGEHPGFLRRKCYQELAADWPKSEMRLLCPPTGLIGALVRKLRLTGAPAVLLVPDWPVPGLAPPVLVQASDGYQHESIPTPTPTGGSMGADAQSEPSMATPLARNKRLTHFPFDANAMENGGAIKFATSTRGVCVVRKEY